MPWTVEPDPSFFISETALEEYASYSDDPEGPPEWLAEDVQGARDAANRGWFTPRPWL